MSDEKSGFSLRIADVVTRFVSPDVALEPHQIYQKFALTNGVKPDIDIQVFYRDIPELEPLRQIFVSGAAWSLYDWQGKLVFKFTSPAVSPELYKLAIFDADFTHGEIYIRPYPHIVMPDPLGYPLDELLMINYLALGRGIDIHACGVVSESGGLAFIGVSGAGKSTTARLWRSRGVKILSDDRIIARKAGDGFWMYGTPWHGDALAALPDKAPLKNIYFLKQYKENRVLPLEPAEIARRLFVRCFPTFYNKRGMESALSLVTELATEVPGYELQFTPDQRAIDEVLSHLESNKLC